MNKQRGLSYVEVTMAAVVLALGLVPVLRNVESASVTADTHGLLAQENAALQSRLDWVRNQPFSQLLAYAESAGGPTVAVSAYSDDATAAVPIEVFLSAYDAADDDGDGDPFTLSDTNADGDGSVYTATLPANMLRLLWVKVQLTGSDRALSTLVRR